MCFHDATSGSHEGLRLAVDWSARGPKPKHGEVERRWRGFEPGGGGGAAVIAATAREHGVHLFAIARKHSLPDLGDRDPGIDVSGLLAGSTQPAISDNAAADEEGPEKPTSLDDRVEQLRSRTLPGDQTVLYTAVRSVVKGLLGQAGLSVVYGDACRPYLRATARKQSYTNGPTD